MTIFWRFASLVEMFGDWVTCYSSLPIYMHDMSFCYLVFVSDCFCQFLSGCWFEVWNFTTFNRGSKATESSEWAVRERERDSERWRREQLARYSDHLSTLILTCYDISDPLFHSAEPLGAAQGVLPSCSFSFPSPLFLNFVLLSFNPAPTQSPWIYSI